MQTPGGINKYTSASLATADLTESYATDAGSAPIVA